MGTISADAPELATLLAPWHDFYVVSGTASATLVGLLFVAASVGASFYKEEKRPAFRAFVSPSVVHFSCAFALSLATLAPLRHWSMFGLLEGGFAIFGLGYSVIILGAMIRLGMTRGIDLEDRVWYAVLPAVAYVVLIASAVLFFAKRPIGLTALPCGIGLLLLIGIRNAWDMTSWSVTRGQD